MMQLDMGYQGDANVYLDKIGQPRCIPNEFKSRNEIKSGIESILLWPIINKNKEINFIYYNQQRFINYTDNALSALGIKLAATSQMAWQNRQALDWLITERGEQCCTFIPNNTAPGGAFFDAMSKLKNLRQEAYENAGQDQHIWHWADLGLGKWKAIMAKMGLILFSLSY